MRNANIISKILTGGSPALRDVDGRRLRVFYMPVAGRAHANQILPSGLILFRKRQVRPLPQRIDVMHRVAFDYLRALTAQELEIIRVQVAPASVPLITLDFLPLLPP